MKTLLPKTIGVVLLVFSATVASSSATADPIKMVPGQKQLFLDDSAVQELSGVTRAMHQPQKKGAVLKPDVPSDGCRVQVYSTAPTWDEKEKVYKFVYMAFPMENFSEIGAALAISKDGLHWEKPDWGQNITVRGSTKNNRIFVDRSLKWGDNSLMGGVIYDPHDTDATRRYKGLMGAINRVPVVSPDAITWTKLDTPPIPSADTSSLMYDGPRKRYVMFGKTSSRFGRSAAISISDDFKNWSKPVLCFSADEEDQKMALKKIRQRLADPGLARPTSVDPDPDTGWKPPAGVVSHPVWRAECYEFAAFPYEGDYIGIVMMYYPTGTEPGRKNTDGFDGLQLVMSHDLKNWTRLGNREDFIPPSRIDKGLVGVFDRQQMTAPGAPLRIGDELWFYYTGFKSREILYALNPDGSPRDQKTLTPQEKADLDDGWSAICLAVLRLDGFISLDAAGDGFVLTKPMTVTGDTLYLNADATGGQAKVEILDEAGNVIPSFSREDCLAVTGDGVRLPVSWQGGTEFGYLTGKTVRFKIYLTKARLYAFGTDFPVTATN
jgi:hypothetical protein